MPFSKWLFADGHAGDQFGHSVAITGNTILSGAPEAAVGSNYAQGVSYLFLLRAASVRDYNNAKKGKIVVYPH